MNIQIKEFQRLALEKNSDCELLMFIYSDKIHLSIRRDQTNIGGIIIDSELFNLATVQNVQRSFKSIQAVHSFLTEYLPDSSFKALVMSWI